MLHLLDLDFQRVQAVALRKSNQSEQSNDNKNEGNDPSISTLIASSGIHPTILVFLPIKAIVIKAVSMIVSILNLFFYLR